LHEAEMRYQIRLSGEDSIETVKRYSIVSIVETVAGTESRTIACGIPLDSRYVLTAKRAIAGKAIESLSIIHPKYTTAFKIKDSKPHHYADIAVLRLESPEESVATPPACISHLSKWIQTPRGITSPLKVLKNIPILYATPAGNDNNTGTFGQLIFDNLYITYVKQHAYSMDFIGTSLQCLPGTPLYLIHDSTAYIVAMVSETTGDSVRAVSSDTLQRSIPELVPLHPDTKPVLEFLEELG
jgi:hypothetical protein